MIYITRDFDGSWQYWDIPAPIKYPSPPIWDEDDQIYYHPTFEPSFWGKTWDKFKQHLFPYKIKRKPNLRKGNILLTKQKLEVER